MKRDSFHHEGKSGWTTYASEEKKLIMRLRSWGRDDATALITFLEMLLRYDRLSCAVASMLGIVKHHASEQFRTYANSNELGLKDEPCTSQSRAYNAQEKPKQRVGKGRKEVF